MIPAIKSGRDGFHVSFHAANLPREEHVRMIFHLQRFRKSRGELM